MSPLVLSKPGVVSMGAWLNAYAFGKLELSILNTKAPGVSLLDYAVSAYSVDFGGFPSMLGDLPILLAVQYLYHHERHSQSPAADQQRLC
jgi:hypothetical protein